MAIDEQYASPGLRWGLLQDDYPEATNEYTLITAEGIPGGHPFAGPDDEFVLCTIAFPLPCRKAPAYGWKPLSEARNRDDESYAALRTKALGRALKDAGYPDKLPDLKALTFWRKRSAEIDAMTLGHPLEIDSTNEVVAALDAAAESTPDAVGHDERGDVVDATVSQIQEIVDDREKHSQQESVQVNSDSTEGDSPEFDIGDGLDEKRVELMEVIAGLDPDTIARLKGFVSDNDLVEDLSTWGAEELDNLEGWLLSPVANSDDGR